MAALSKGAVGKQARGLFSIFVCQYLKNANGTRQVQNSKLLLMTDKEVAQVTGTKVDDLR